MVPVSSSYQVHSMRICPFFFVLFVLEMCMTTWLHLMWFVSVVGGRGRCWCDELSETERRLCEVEGKDSVPCGGQQLIDGISCPSIPLARPLSPPSPPVTGLAWLNGYGSPWWWSLLKNYCTRPCFVSSTQGLEKQLAKPAPKPKRCCATASSLHALPKKKNTSSQLQGERRQHKTSPSTSYVHMLLSTYC